MKTLVIQAEKAWLFKNPHWGFEKYPKEIEISVDLLAEVDEVVVINSTKNPHAALINKAANNGACVRHMSYKQFYK